MAFALEKLFVDVFAPHSGDVVTIMYDLPHGEIRDHKEWRERRKMAEEWHQHIIGFSASYDVLVNPIVTYEATGAHNSDMPEYGMCEGERIQLEDIIVYDLGEDDRESPIGFQEFANAARVA